VVTASTAGIESTAKITSVVSMTISASSSGVASSRVPSRTRNRWPCSCPVLGSTRRSARTARLRSGCGGASRSILTADQSSTTPNT
jgi:hypothetical protein